MPKKDIFTTAKRTKLRSEITNPMLGRAKCAIKNMKKIILLFLLLVEGTNAQVSFYVAPVINVKGNYRSNGFKNFYNKTSYQNEFFEYQSRRLLFSSLGLGIKGGIGLNDRWLFDFGWSTDETRSGNRFYTTSYSDNTVYGGYKNYTPSNGGSFYIGVQTNRFHLSAQYKLINPQKFEHKKFWVVPYISTGLGLNVSTYKTPQLEAWTYEGGYSLIDENVSMKADYSLNVGNRTNVHGLLGLSTDFMVKKHYLFSFSVYSTFSFQTKTKNHDLSVIHTRITINDVSGTRQYGFIEGSKGTGLYFEISRRFQLYPWRPNKKAKEL